MSTTSGLPFDIESAFAFTLTAPRDRDTDDARRSRELVGTLLRLVSSSTSSAPPPSSGAVLGAADASAAPEPAASSAPLLLSALDGEAPAVPSGTSRSSPGKSHQRRRASLHALPSRAALASETAASVGATVAHPLLSPHSDTPFSTAFAHDDDLPSLDTVDALPSTAIPGFVADLAARQAYLAALQARAAARLTVMGAPASGSERIAPGQRLSAHQLAERMGRSVDYVYRHADDWPFTVREGRSVSFDEASFVRWQAKRTAANGARRREAP